MQVTKAMINPKCAFAPAFELPDRIDVLAGGLLLFPGRADRFRSFGERDHRTAGNFHARRGYSGPSERSLYGDILLWRGVWIGGRRLGLRWQVGQRLSGVVPSLRF